MDNVSSIFIKYNFIRMPKEIVDNVLSYAAVFSIEINADEFVNIDDFAIMDFALALNKWLRQPDCNFNFKPMDYEDIILSFVYRNGCFEISSIWSEQQKTYKIRKQALLDCMKDFIEDIKDALMKQGLNFDKQCEIGRS